MMDGQDRMDDSLADGSSRRKLCIWALVDVVTRGRAGSRCRAGPLSYQCHDQSGDVLEVQVDVGKLYLEEFKLVLTMQAFNTS